MIVVGAAFITVWYGQERVLELRVPHRLIALGNLGLVIDLDQRLVREFQLMVHRHQESVAEVHFDAHLEPFLGDSLLV